MTGPVALEDIADVVGWVKWQVGRFAERGSFSRDEVDDMISTGIVILYETHEKWDPLRSARFSAYALAVFRNRLIDWFRGEVRSSNRGHVVAATKEIIYHGMTSLDAPVQDDALVTMGQDRALTHYDATDA